MNSHDGDCLEEAASESAVTPSNPESSVPVKTLHDDWRPIPSGLTDTHGQARSPFIPTWFDDAGLSPTAFRVLSHLWRRRNAKTGQCNPSAGSIAKTCGLNRKTVFVALADLEKQGLIRRRRNGFAQSNSFSLIVPTSVSSSSTTDTAHSSQKTGHHSSHETESHLTPKRGHHSSQKTGHHSSHKAVRKGSQEKVLKGKSPNEGLSEGEVDPKIAEIFNVYPNQVGKYAAYQAIRLAIERDGFDQVRAGTLAYHTAVNGWRPEDRYRVPKPAKWFADGGYLDDPERWHDITRRHLGNNKISAVLPEDHAKGF